MSTSQAPEDDVLNKGWLRRVISVCVFRIRSLGHIHAVFISWKSWTLCVLGAIGVLARDVVVIPVESHG